MCFVRIICTQQKYFHTCRSSEGVDVNDTYEDLCCVLYNNMLNQVVMVKSLGMVKVYQSEVRVFVFVCLDVAVYVWLYTPTVIVLFTCMDIHDNIYASME